MNFEIKNLGDICRDVSDGTHYTPEYVTEGVPFLSVKNVRENGITFADCRYVSEKAYLDLIKRSKPERGDLLYTKVGTTGVAKTIETDADFCIFVSLALLKLNDFVFPQYVERFLNSPAGRRQAQRLTQGATNKNLVIKDIKKIKIPLPPLEEQKRIAAVLDKADLVREKRRRALNRLDELLQAVFLDMFGDPVSNPKGWEIGTIRDLILSANYGTSEKSEAVGKYPVLRMNNITYQGGWDFSNLKYSDFDESDVEKYLVKKGELLFNRTNSKELVGKTAVFRENKPMAFAGYLIRVRTNSKNNTEYISAFLNSDYGKTTLMNMCKNIIGMANINAQELQNIRIPKPPTELQNQFADIVEKVEEMKLPYQKNLETVETLFQSLQQRAFAGELFGAANEEIASLKTAAAD